MGEVMVLLVRVPLEEMVATVVEDLSGTGVLMQVVLALRGIMAELLVEPVGIVGQEEVVVVLLDRIVLIQNKLVMVVMEYLLQFRERQHIMLVEVVDEDVLAMELADWEEEEMGQRVLEQMDLVVVVGVIWLVGQA